MIEQFIKLSSPSTREFWRIQVLYEDDALLALDKPAGLLTSPDENLPDAPDLVGLLHAGIAERKPWATERRLTFLKNIHRLDREVSGTLLFAKAESSLHALSDAAGAGKFLRSYLTLVKGNPRESQFEINAKLAPNRARPGRMCVDELRGKKSQSRFEVVEAFDGWTLLRCVVAVERLHQVRVHLRHAGLPIAGDHLYGGRPLLLSRMKPGYRLKEGRTERPLIPGLALHCEQLSFDHPSIGTPLVISSPQPKDFKVALKYLRQYAQTHASPPRNERENHIAET